MFGDQNRGSDDSSTMPPSEPNNTAPPSDDGALNGVNDLANNRNDSSLPPMPATDDNASNWNAGQNDNSSSTPPAATTSDSDNLLDLKQQALQQLTPLVGHLNQSPEEKFRTTMMMIQASDNQDLLKSAYDAAQEISDEKLRAQALLDVVNEINYFTQQKSQD